MQQQQRPALTLSRPLEAPAALRYGLALLVVLLAMALRALPHRLIDEGSPFLVFYPAVIAAALYLGAGPALLCLGVSLAALVRFFPPRGDWLVLESNDLTDLGLFIAVSLGLIALIRAHQASRARAEDATRALESHARALEHEIAERRRAEDALRRSNEDLEEFSHAISHDLKEPLRGIALTAEFLLEDLGPAAAEPERAKLRRLVHLPRQMMDQLSALLEYSRIGHAELAVETADMAELAREAAEPLAPWLEQRRAHVTITGPFPPVRCDRVRVARILSNLITNAVKYNDAASPRIEIGASVDGPVPAFYVRDNGIGIAPERAGDVFRMFRRAHADTEYGGGTGSGLALTKRTVERHGGRIWFDSAPGRGTTFYFTLQPDPAAPSAPAPSTLALPVKVAPDLRPRAAAAR